MKYRVTIRTNYGNLTMDDIEASSDVEAIMIATKWIQFEIDSADVDEIHRYE